MPIYEFECGCGEVEEILVPLGTNSIKCKNCGKVMKRVMSISNFILKGSGWAFDGYGNTKTQKKNK